MEIPLYRLFVRTALAWIAGYTLLLSSASAQDGLRLAVSHGLDPRIPLSQIYIDSDPCAQPSKRGFEVTVVVETVVSSQDDNVLLGAVNSVNHKILNSVRRGCDRLLDTPFKAYVTALIDGLPVTRAEVSSKPGPPGTPLPLLSMSSKKILNTPATTETQLGAFLNQFFAEVGPLRDRGRPAPGLDVDAALVMVEAIERRRPELDQELSLLKAELYRNGQKNWRGLEPGTIEKFREVARAGNAMASNVLIRAQYNNSIGLVLDALRNEAEIPAGALEGWKLLYPDFIQGLSNGSFAAYDVEQAITSLGGVITDDGISYEVYDGPRKEDVERGLSAATSRTNALGASVIGGRFAEYGKRHYSCDTKWCDFGDGNAKWRLITRGRPTCRFLGDDLAECLFPWRPNVQMDTRTFGVNSVYQGIMTSMNKVTWYPGRAQFAKNGDTWTMVGMPDLGARN